MTTSAQVGVILISVAVALFGLHRCVYGDLWWRWRVERLRLQGFAPIERPDEWDMLRIQTGISLICLGTMFALVMLAIG